MKQMQTLLNIGRRGLFPGFSSKSLTGDVLYLIGRLNTGHLTYLRTAPIILCQCFGLAPLL